MPNWIKLSEQKKRTLIANTLLEIEKQFPLKKDDDFEVLLKCFYSIKEGKFVESHFRALLEIPNGKNYWNIIRCLVLKGNIDEMIIEQFEKEHLE
jgi:predicted PolB exonuclease-like 3'-5' exonuclease